VTAGPGPAPLRIGISACFFHPDPDRPIFKGKTLLYLEQSMAHWVAAGGALPYLVPTMPSGGGGTSFAGIDDVVADLDGLLLHGGADVCPRTYGEEPLRPEWEGDEVRDRYEIDLVHRFRDAGKPVLGICRGAQVVNVAFGGTLYQDIAMQVDTERVHRSQELYDANRHEVDIEPGSGLAALYPGIDRAAVNSIHHQAVKDVGDGLAVEARSSDDGIVEALRLRGDNGWVVGVQWHPEFFDPDDETLLDTDPVRREFLDRARAVRDQATTRSAP
jgi:putative glutamine amidotransferase